MKLRERNLMGLKKRERSNCRWPAHRTEQLSLAHILCSSHCSLSKLQTLSNGMQQANLNKYMAPFPEATYWQRSMSVYYSLGEQSEKAMATYSSTLAWKIPWTEEPGGLQSMGSLRVRRDWATSLSIFTFLHWRRKWQPTPVFLPGESQGLGSLAGCHLWGHTESGTRLKWLSSSSRSSLKSRKLIPPALFFFLKIALASQGLFCFHTNWNFFSSSVKNGKADS